MKVLALETSASACSIAIQVDDKIQVHHEIAPMQQAKIILPIIHELLNKNLLSLHDLDAITYGCGPGSFTGVRIANSVAQGLGFAINKPIIPVSSLAILAQTAAIQAPAHIYQVALDARMHQVYWGRFGLDECQTVELIGAEELCNPDSVTVPEGNDWCGVGDGWSIYQNELIQRLNVTAKIDALLLPHAQALLVLAQKYYKQGKVSTAAQACPVYLR